MPVFIAVIFLSLNLAKSGGAIRPVVTFTPNWGNILPGDDVTLTCNIPSTVPEEPRTYYWYKDNQSIQGGQQTFQITSSALWNSGDYQCRTSAIDISDPITLNVTNNFVILQRPPSTIYEGDPLTLRCHHAPYYSATKVKLYKDNEEIKSQFSYSEFHIHKVDLNTSGNYKCSMELRYPNSDYYYMHSDKFSISVNELFSPPAIKVSTSWVIEGDDMMVRCDTRLDQLRVGTKLQFAFYRDGQTVQEFSASDTHRVRSLRVENSGNYTCAVRTESDIVRKMSDEVYIPIYSKALVVTVLTVAVVGGLLIIIFVVVLIWRCKKRKESSASNQGPPQETAAMAVTEPDPDPQDVCYTYLELTHMPKGNKIRNDELTVTYATVKKQDS